MTCFVFCHGFGFDPTFWNPLRLYFSEMNTVYLDLGYFGEEQHYQSINANCRRPAACPGDPEIQCQIEIHGSRGEALERRQFPTDYIGIGHSLGLIKLMSLNIPFKRLIGLQGFVHFQGFDEQLHRRRKRELMRLTGHFNASPELTLNQFYQRTGVDFNVSQKASLNRMKLSDDLALLTAPVFVPVDVPMLVLGSNDDTIVPLELIEDNFAHHPQVTIDIINQAQHGLGYFKPDVVYQKIMSFLEF